MALAGLAWYLKVLITLRGWYKVPVPCLSYMYVVIYFTMLKPPPPPYKVLYYTISREKFEPEPGFEPRTSGSNPGSGSNFSLEIL